MPWRERVYALVRRIPRGRVTTYGELARLLGRPRGGREVGWALADCDDASVPCHRVVDRHGRTARVFPTQRPRLEDEGVRFIDGRVDLARYEWRVVTRSSGGPRERETSALRPSRRTSRGTRAGSRAAR